MPTLPTHLGRNELFTLSPSEYFHRDFSPFLIVEFPRINKGILGCFFEEGVLVLGPYDLFGEFEKIKKLELQKEGGLAKEEVGEKVVIDGYFLLGMRVVVGLILGEVICVYDHKPDEEALLAFVPGAVLTAKFLADIISNIKKELLIM